MHFQVPTNNCISLNYLSYIGTVSANLSLYYYTWIHHSQVPTYIQILNTYNQILETTFHTEKIANQNITNQVFLNDQISPFKIPLIHENQKAGCILMVHIGSKCIVKGKRQNGQHTKA